MSNLKVLILLTAFLLIIEICYLYPSLSKHCATEKCSTNQLEDINNLSFTVHIMDLKVMTIYSGNFINAVKFDYKNGSSVIYGNILNLSKNFKVTPINLMNNSIVSFKLFTDSWVKSMQYLLYDKERNKFEWTIIMGQTDGKLLSSDANINEVKTIYGIANKIHLKEWIIEYKYNRQMIEETSRESSCKFENGKKFISSVETVFLDSKRMMTRNWEKCCLFCELTIGCDYFFIKLIEKSFYNCSTFALNDSDNFKQLLLMGEFFEKTTYPDSISGFTNKYLFDPNDW